MKDFFIENTYPVLFLVGFIFIVTGLILKFFPPKKINSLYGYRMPSAMQNQATWDFAQIYAANRMVLAGVKCLALGFLKWFTGSTNEIIISVALVILLVVIMIYEVEKAIKQKFPKHVN